MTGGTGDIKPQIMVFANAIAADDYTVVRQVLPVPRFGTQKSKSTIFEILTLRYIFSSQGSETGATIWGYMTPTTVIENDDTSNATTFQVDIRSSRNFGFVYWTTNLVTEGGNNTKWPITVDMTDRNGNGFLIATDEMNFVCGNTGASTGHCRVEVTYRLVNVGLEEYVGIVQSQTSAQ